MILRPASPVGGLGVIKTETKKQNTGAEKQKLFPTDI